MTSSNPLGKLQPNMSHSTKGPFVSQEQQSYISSHPLALWFCIGLAIISVITFVAPHLLGESPVSLALPSWVHFIFGLWYFLGSILSIFGITRSSARAEAAGMNLIASALLVQFLSAVYVVHSAAIGGIFILTLAIGCLQRAHFLTKRGQV